jgi:hypothetical protein
LFSSPRRIGPDASQRLISSAAEEERMRRIKFGVRIPVTGPVSSSEHLLAATLEAEQLGFDAALSAMPLRPAAGWRSSATRSHRPAVAPGEIPGRRSIRTSSR